MATLTISDRQIPLNSHDYYDITFDDDEILTLVTASPSMVDMWISEILRIHRRRLHRLVVGLDVEWRPNFDRHFRNPVATLQLCVGRRCLIFQLIHASETPQSLIDFLEDDTFTFVGVGIDNDVLKLYNDYDLNVANTVDLRELAADEMQSDEFRTAGLKTLGREVLGREIDKPRNVKLSRWDRQWLNPAQILYATVDAFLSFEIGRYLLS
ncbi:Werner Syndrome-like exonuclease [Cucumis sativus]|uniref:3'-5' exonuclease domain-containing protein n=1 Tax=Cucumis sativus TaxID=3659 RepID=A0A0A0LHC5_CUCSA|nr:Werner Syndrome-like exonuclease [Cucumis sativus]